MAKELKYEDLDLPVYKNSRKVFAGLDVSDLAKAAILSGLNVFLVGGAGTGKTQLLTDIYQNYFRGNIADGGNGILMRAHPEIDIYNEVFTKLDLDRRQRAVTNSIDAMIFGLDEINRAHPVAQNQFLGLGDGRMDYQGKGIKLGKNGYHVLVATANMGNGEYAGTFELDKAMLQRLHIALDLDYSLFKPTLEDEEEIEKRKANPNVIISDARDISEKIADARKVIVESTQKQDLETRAALNYIRHGLKNCLKYKGEKGREWPMGCQDCEHNKNNALCSLIREPATRTTEVIRAYAEALDYLARLKNPKVRIDRTDLIFKAFELSGAYQNLLNSAKLKDIFGNNPKLMAEVSKSLRQDYDSVKDYVIASLSEAQTGKKLVSFAKLGKRIGNWDELEEEDKPNFSKEEPFTNARPIGLKWVSDLSDLTIKEGAKQKKEGTS